jgi:methionyl-tRNA synthetase
MAAGLPVPRQIVSHGWWLMEGAKMSKSKGNVVRPHVYVERFGLDAVRYFVFREMAFGQDANFADEAILTRYNSDLANDLGNVVSRVTTMVHRYCDGIVPSPHESLLARAPEMALQAAARDAVDHVKAAVRGFQLSDGLRSIWDVISGCNRYIVAREPWKLAKTAETRAELETALYVSADILRVIAELVRPFMPGTGERTLRMLGIEPNATSWNGLDTLTLAAGTRMGESGPLFPRIEQTVEELRAMADTPDQGAHAAPGPPPSSSSSPPPQAPQAGGSPAAQASASQAPPAVPGDKIAIDDFMRVELRVAKVLAAERVPKSSKLLKLQVDTGVDQRTIVAGIAESYEPEALVGRSIAIVFNLKPAKLMGIESNGMVLAASPDGGKAQLVTFDDPPPPGTRVR